jgi:hypothetical protein
MNDHEPIGRLPYPLHNGYIHNWLSAGPVALLVPDLQPFTTPDGATSKLRIVEHYYEADAGVPNTPAEGHEGWRYRICDDDHLLDFSVFHHNCHYLRSWAYAELHSPSNQTATFTLTTNGPADVWLNGAHVHRHAHFHHQQPHSVGFEGVLHAGLNTVLVRVEEVAIRECPYAMALHMTGEFSDDAVRIPSTVQPLDRRTAFERFFAEAVLDRDVFIHDQPIILRWPTHVAAKMDVTIRLQRPDGRIYSESQRRAGGGARLELGQALQFPEGDYRVVLMPSLKEYYEGNMRVQRELPLSLVRNRYSTQPYATQAERAQEALIDAAQRDDGIFNDIARMALGLWHNVDEARLLGQISSIASRADCSDFYLCGLLGALYRFGEDARFPSAVRDALARCILGFRYSAQEPGSDAMNNTTENHRILFHTCEVLAGQLFPEQTFSNNGQTGQWHKQNGERLAFEWLRQKAAGGFVEWDSNCYFEEDALALTHLADLAEDDALADLATVLLDKMFFSMAVNSFKGVFGSTHGRAYTQHLLGGQREATAGMARILFGMGVFNNSVRGSVALACSNYALPPVIANIAAHQPEALCSRERVVGSVQAFNESGRMHGPEVTKVTFKTPDYMLCSAQDYHPGKRGYQQHIWQATLGPEAVVFVTHPPCTNKENSRRPNFWHGNYTLPRVAQYNDALIAVHELENDDWLGFTHAYFPLYAFDQHDLAHGNDGALRWAFGRKGGGYVALCALRGFELVRRGNSAGRELRSQGARNVWLCQMGRAAQDGAFDDFKARVLASAIAFDEADLSVTWRTVRGDELRFGWRGEFLRNGEVEPTSGFKHYDNPYCVAELNAPSMDIRLGEDLVRLSFG